MSEELIPVPQEFGPGASARARQARLREPFPDKVRGLLFKAYKKVERGDPQPGRMMCRECGQVHSVAPGTHISYVGHAAVTDRLLQVDPGWTWEPMAFEENGLPKFQRAVAGNPLGLWIRLTVLGVTRLGYGSVDDRQFEAEKVLIGDAIRNAAMRFGVALDEWSKDILESNLPEEGDDELAGRHELAPAQPRSALPKASESSAPKKDRKTRGPSSQAVQEQDQRQDDKALEDARMEQEASSFATEPSTASLVYFGVPIPDDMEHDHRAWDAERVLIGPAKGRMWGEFLSLRPGQKDEHGLFKALHALVQQAKARAAAKVAISLDEYRAVLVARQLEPHFARTSEVGTASDLLETP